MYVEDDILNSPPIRHNINAYPKEEKNFNNDSSMVLLDDENLCDTIIAGNTDLSGNNIPDSRNLVLSSLYIGDAKYRIY